MFLRFSTIFLLNVASIPKVVFFWFYLCRNWNNDMLGGNILFALDVHWGNSKTNHNQEYSLLSMVTLKAIKLMELYALIGH